jgi:predicted nucleic acid-binding protein
MQAILDAARCGECRLFINVVNLGEVFYVSAKRRDMDHAHEVMQTMRSHFITISSNDELVMFAAALKARYPISYADGFAAATAILQQAPLVTGDPELRAMAASEKQLLLDWIG